MTNNLDLLLQDFGEFSKRAFTYRDRDKKIEKGPTHDLREWVSFTKPYSSLQFYDDIGLVWWDGIKAISNDSLEKVGTPEDYLKIRDNYQALKSFVASTLDKGKICVSYGRYGNFKTDCADYISWLHKNNQNLDFQRKIQRATTELLLDEFERDFIPYDLEHALKKVTQDFETSYYKGDITKKFFDEEIETSRWRSKISDPVTLEEIKFREEYDRELIPTIKSNSEKQNRLTTHFKETSKEFQEKFKQRYLNLEAQELALQDFSPQFNRLIGLLDVISYIGEHDNRFEKIYSPLRQKVESRFMANSPEIDQEYIFTDIYSRTLFALSSIQKGSELKEFWLDNIQTESNYKRLVTLVHGAFTMDNFLHKKNKLISNILKNIQQRGYDMEEFDENLWELESSRKFKSSFSIF